MWDNLPDGLSNHKKSGLFATLPFTRNSGLSENFVQQPHLEIAAEEDMNSLSSLKLVLTDATG